MNHGIGSPKGSQLEEIGAGRDLDRLVDVIDGSDRIAVFTGAGISTESGIPDYRGPNGVWARQAVPHIDTIRDDAETRRAFWQERRQRYPEMLAKKPNAGHRAIARLEAAGKVLAIITQNIDGLHQKAGSDPNRVIELHGTTHTIRCMNCGREYPGVEIQERLEAGETEPRCVVCGGPMRSATILFGESLPQDKLRTAFTVAQACDVMLVVGSSLVVNPAARLPVLAKQQGARLVIINREPTPLDELADIRIIADAGPTLDAVARRVLDEQDARYADDEAAG